MTLIKTTIAVVCFLCLCACTTAPTPRYYLLDSGVENNIQKNYRKISHVRVPSYLQTGSLVLQIGPQEMRVASFHFWAESLEQGIERAFDASFGDLTTLSEQQADGLRIAIDVKRFHGNLDAQVSLMADWRATSGCSDVSGSYSHSIVQDKSGYPALVAAQVKLVEMMASEVAAKLEGGACS